MSPELDAHLCVKHPHIFADRQGDITFTAMCWGFRVGDGWYPLLDVLCEELQRDTAEKGAPQVVATQVKEKFGGLRFYVKSASERQRAMIDLAEALSFHLCEECGAPGTADEHHKNGTVDRCPVHTR